MAQIDSVRYDDVLLGAMTMVADAMIDYMAGDAMIPIDTHNLKDGLGVAVYHHGVLRKFAMSPKAQEPRTNIGLAPYPTGDVWGKNLIQELMDSGATKYSDGSCIVLYSAMPYGDIQNAEGVNEGFFDVDLVGEFKSIVDEVLTLYQSKK